MTQTNPLITDSMLEFLRWVVAEQRSYADAMEAWRTSCPRFSVWEDASIAGYIELRQVGANRIVALTDLGRTVLSSR